MDERRDRLSVQSHFSIVFIHFKYQVCESSVYNLLNTPFVYLFYKLNYFYSYDKIIMCKNIIYCLQ